MVEVFKTNVQEHELAKQLTAELLSHFPQCKINFDLQDCDRILRVEGKDILPGKVMQVININGYLCQVLE